MDMRWFPGRSILNSDWTINLAKTNINKRILTIINKEILMNGHTVARHAVNRMQFKEARNSFFGLGVYLLKSKFRIEGELRFP